MSCITVSPPYRTGSRGTGRQTPGLTLPTGPCVAQLGLSPDLPDAMARAQGVGPLPYPKGERLALALGEGAGTSVGTASQQLLRVAGPEPSLRQLPAWHPLEEEEAGHLRNQGLGSEKAFVFSCFLHKQPLSARPQGRRETRPPPGLGKPKPWAVALTFSPGQGNSMWPEGASVCSLTSPKQVMLEIGREGPISKGQSHRDCSEVNPDWLAGRKGSRGGRVLGDAYGFHGRHCPSVQLLGRQRSDLVLPRDQGLLPSQHSFLKPPAHHLLGPEAPSTFREGTMTL